MPVLQKVVRSTVVDAPIERVWAVIRDFNSHDQWHGVVDRSRTGIPVQRCELLPFNRQHSVTLKITKCAVIGEDVKAIRWALKSTARLMTTVVAVTLVGIQHRNSLFGRHLPNPILDLPFR